jgi:hypothetical protein
MSTISLPFENGIRHIVVCDAVATETTMKTFIATASNKEVAFLDGSGAAVAGNSKDFLIAKKSSTGVVSKSDLITGKDIVSLRTSAPVAKVGKKQVVTIASVAVDKEYSIDLRVNYGTLPEYFASVKASVVAVTGDTATTLATKLGVALAIQLDQNISTGYRGQKGTAVMIAGTSVPVNRYFALTQVAGALTITEKDFILDNYVTGIRAFDQLMWNAAVSSSADAYGIASTLITKTETAATVAKGQGYQVRELEHYLGSHNKTFGYADRTMGNQSEYESVLATSYYTIDFAYADTGRDDPQHLNKGVFIACSSKAEVNKIGAAIAAAGGPAWTDYL